MARERFHVSVVLVCAGAALVAGQFFGAFTVPDTDFFAFRENALSYLQFQLPESLKRLPLFPMLLALISRPLPYPEPILPASLWLNLALMPVAVWLTVRVARRFVSPVAALAIGALVAVNPAMVYCATQPLLEMLLLSLTLLTVDLALAGSRWAYVAAALASLTRYEAAALIPGLVLRDVRSRDRHVRRRALTRGALASVGIATWIALSASRHEAVSPYLQETLAREAHPLAFLLGMIQVAVDVLPGGLFVSPALSALVIGFGLLLFIVGVRRLVRRHGALLVVPGTLFISYVLIHTAFPAYKPRYVLPILWMVYLAMASAVEALDAWLAGRWRRRLEVVVGLVAAPLLVHSAIRMAAQPIELISGWALLSAGIGAARFVRRRRFQAAPRWSVAGPLAGCVVLAFGLRATSLLMAEPWVRDNCAQFRALAAWYRQAARPGDRMAVTLPGVVQYYSGLPAEAFLPSESLTAETPEAVVEELRRLGATYAVWDSDFGRDPTTYHARRYRAELLTALREHPPAGMELVRTIVAASKTADVFRVR